MTEEEKRIILDELRKFPKGVPLSELGRRIGINGQKLSNLLVALRNNRDVFRRSDLWLINPDKPADKPPAEQKSLSLDDILAELDSKYSVLKPAGFVSAYQTVLNEIYSKSIGARWFNVLRHNLTNNGDLLEVLEKLADLNLVTVISPDKVSLTLNGLQLCDNKWTAHNVAYSVLNAIEELNTEKHEATARDVARKSELYNTFFFTEMLDYFIDKDLIGWEQVRLQPTGSARTYLISKRGIEFLKKLREITGHPEQKPVVQTVANVPPSEPPKAPVQSASLSAPQPAPQVVPQTKPEKLEEICFSWGKAKVEIVEIFGKAYKLTYLGEKGNFSTRIADLRTRGVTGLIGNEWKYLTTLTKYVSNGEFDLQKAYKETKLPIFKIHNLLQSYKNKGITGFPEVAYAPPADIQRPAAPDITTKPSPNYTDTEILLQKFDEGARTQKDAVKSLVDLLGNEIADLKKRIETLEQKK